MLFGVAKRDNTSWEYVTDFDMLSDKSKYMMRRLGKYTEGVTHVNLTIPTYLLNHVEAWSSSKSLLVTLIVEEYCRRYEILDSKFPNLSSLYLHLVRMDRFAEKVKKTGGRNHETDRVMRAYRAYIRKFARVVQRGIDEMAGFETAPARLRVVIPVPHPRLRPDRRRQTDSDTERELGRESDTTMERLREDIDAKRELFQQDPQRFKQLFPDDYDDWYKGSDAEHEEEVEEPLGN